MKVFKVSNDNFLQAAEALKRGKVFPELILVAPTDKFDSEYLVALEGHLRLTAYALVPEYIPEFTPVIIGISENIKKWPEY